jgi:hypothetical protein
MFINIAGQNFGCSSWGADGQVMIDYGVSQFMCQNTLMYISSIDVYGVLFENIP